MSLRVNHGTSKLKELMLLNVVRGHCAFQHPHHLSLGGPLVLDAAWFFLAPCEADFLGTPWQSLTT